MSRTQTLVQLSDDLLAVLDERAHRSGVSRSALIRNAVEAFLADDLEAALDAAIAAGYARTPCDPVDEATMQQAVAAIAEEEW